MIRYITAQKAEIDIHNMSAESARRYIEQFLSKAADNVKEVAIIHGYSGGTALSQMVMDQLTHQRIKEKVRSVNPGITILFLKQDF